MFASYSGALGEIVAAAQDVRPQTTESKEQMLSSLHQMSDKCSSIIAFFEIENIIIPILKNIGYIPLRRITEIDSLPTNNDVHSMSNLYTQRL